MIKVNTYSSIFFFAALILCSFCCQDQNCENCDTYIGDSTGTIVETCYSCISGFKLDSNSQCIQDKALVIGIAIGAAAALVAQIICYLYCKHRFGSQHKKKADISLEDIYNQEIYSSQDGKEPDQQNYQKQKPKESEEKDSESIKSQFKVFVTHDCGMCDEQKTSIRTACGHFFHHECFKKEIMSTPDVCPQCTKRTHSPIQMMCCTCLNKKRSIPLQSISNYQHFREYICVNCKLKKKREVEQKKWWKRCC